MVQKSQVALFLNEFRRCWPPRCMVAERSKNFQALAELGLTAEQRRNIILNLPSQDFVEGPLSNHSNQTEAVWVFGKKVNETEIYIKLKVYEVKSKQYAKCLSFHKAEFALKYPFK